MGRARVSHITGFVFQNGTRAGMIWCLTREDPLSQLFSQSNEDEAFPFIAGMDKDLVTAINAWRLAQRRDLAPSAAILALLRNALKQDGFMAVMPPPAPSDDRAMAALIDVFRQVARRA